MRSKSAPSKRQSADSAPRTGQSADSDPRISQSADSAPNTSQSADSAPKKSQSARSKSLPAKTKTRSIKMGGKGQLTKLMIKKLPEYYRIAIKYNDTIEGMQKAIWATFLHMTSTDENPKHHYCTERWCNYKKWEAKIKKERKEFFEKQKSEDSSKCGFYSQKQQVFVPSCPAPAMASFKLYLNFKEGTVKYKLLEDLYTTLSDADLLTRCLGHKTQNPNESFHARLWNLCPKHRYFGRDIVEFAMCQTILFYHKGYIKMGGGYLHEVFEIKTTKGMLQMRKIKELERTKVYKSKSKVKPLADKDYIAGGFLYKPDDPTTNNSTAKDAKTKTSTAKGSRGKGITTKKSTAKDAKTKGSTAKGFKAKDSVAKCTTAKGYTPKVPTSSRRSATRKDSAANVRTEKMTSNNK